MRLKFCYFFTFLAFVSCQTPVGSNYEDSNQLTVDSVGEILYDSIISEPTIANSNTNKRFITPFNTLINYKIIGVYTENMDNDVDELTLKQFSGKQISLIRYNDHVQVQLPDKTIYYRPNENYHDTYSFYEKNNIEDNIIDGLFHNIQGLDSENGTITIFIEEDNTFKKATGHKGFIIRLICEKI